MHLEYWDYCQNLKKKEMKNKQPISSDENLNRNITTYSNVDDGLIRIMETKLENILLKHKRTIESGSDWKTPVGLFIAIAPILGAGSFDKDLLGIPKEYWGAGYVIVMIFSIVWFLQSMYSRWVNRKENINSLIDRIKADKGVR